MNNPILYANSNTLQKTDAEDTIRDYFHLIKFSKHGGDKIIDIGCGDGTVTVEILFRNIPPTFGELIGIDLSPQMIQHARATYTENIVDFQVLDIASELNNEFKNRFDHVFSFNCLHWIQNQRTAMENIHSLLKSKGVCLLSFNAKNDIFDIYKILAENPRWSIYMKDYQKYIGPYHYSEDPTLQCRRLMEDVGFSYVQVESKQKCFYFKGLKSFKDFVFAINPFLKKIPSDLHDQYFEEYEQYFRHLNLIDEENNNVADEVIIKGPYLLITCYAIK